MSAQRLLRFLAALCVLGVLAGCSGTRLAYNNADTLVRWIALDYLDLGELQEADLRERAARVHAWHRTHELPRYGKLLHDATERLADGLTPAKLDWAWNSVLQRYRRLAAQAAPEIAALLVTLTPQQLAHLEERNAESDRKFAKKYLEGGASEQRLRRDKRNRELLEEWFGELSPAQEAALHRASAQLPLLYDLRLQNRQRRQRELLALIRSHRDAAALVPRLSHWLQNWDEGGDAEYLRLSKVYRARFTDLLVEIDRSLSREQREHALARLRDYAELAFALAATEATPRGSAGRAGG